MRSWTEQINAASRQVARCFYAGDKRGHKRALEVVKILKAQQRAERLERLAHAAADMIADSWIDSLVLESEQPK